jgi:hypothetical protein
MSSLTVDLIISLDGYGGLEGWPGYWGMEGPEYLAWLEAAGGGFRVVVFPVITGATGKDRIFDGYPDIALDLVKSRTFDDRLQLLEYVPTVLDGPP